MKDFLTAWQAGEKINASRTDREYKSSLTDAQKQKTTRDNDPETLELEAKQARAKLAATQQSTAASAQSMGLTAERIKNAQLARQMALQPENSGSGLMPPASGALPIPQLDTEGTGGAVNPNATAGYEGGGRVLTDEEVREQRRELDQPRAQLQHMVRRGKYAEGGMVPDEDTDPGDEDDLAPVGAVPLSGSTDFSSAGRKPSGTLEGIVSPQLAADAVRHGLTWGANSFGLSKVGGIRTTQQKQAAQRYVQGAGGLTTEEMEAAKKAVDPKGQLSEAQRNIAALGSVYQFQMNKGDPEGAQRIAFQMLQHYRVASQRYAAIAAHAVESGDLDLATKAATRAYANIPDGRDFQVKKTEDGKLQYTYTDEVTGKVLSKGIATPQQLAASAMGLAQGGFDKALLQAAGARDAGTKAAPKAATARDRKTMGEISDEPVAKAKEAWTKANEGKPADEEYWSNLSDATQHIISENPKTTPNEAFKAAQALYTLDKADPKKTRFKVLPGEEDGQNIVKLDSGHKITLSDDQLQPILLARAAALKARQAEADKPKEKGTMEKMGDALSSGASAVGNLASEAGSAAGTIGGILGRGAVDVGRAAGKTIGAVLPEELAARGGSAIEKTGDMARSVAEDLRGKYKAISNTGAIPGVDAPL